jgi:hypothetical protein
MVAVRMWAEGLRVELPDGALADARATEFEFRSWPSVPQGSLGGADILVCQLGRLSSRPRSRTGKSGEPAGWKACPT